MSAIYKRGNAAIESNLTPMIDVTFLLIVFFVLVSQIVESENVPMDLAQPEQAATLRPGDEPRAVVNIIPADDGSALGYRLGSRTFAPDSDGLDQLAGRLSELFAANPALHVNLRADRTTHFRHVEPVIRAVSQGAARSGQVSGEARLNLVVSREEAHGDW